MAYFNPVINEVLTKERQQAFLRQAEARHLFHQTTIQQARPAPGFLITIRNLASNLSRRWVMDPVVCGDCGN